MAPPRSLQPQILAVLVLMLFAASLDGAYAQYASRSRRSLWTRARKLFEFPALHKSQLSKVGFTYEIARQPAKPTTDPSTDAATDPATSVAASTPSPPSATPSRPPSTPSGGSPAGGSPPADFESSGNPLFPGATTTPAETGTGGGGGGGGAGANPTTNTPATPKQQPGVAADASAVILPAAAPSQPPPPPPPPPTPEGPCPPLPTMCDFYFQDSPSTLPVFNVSDGAGDTRLGGAIEASVRGATVDVITANSEKADYVCQDGVNVWSEPSNSPGGTIIPGLPPADNSSSVLGPDDQFYASQDGIQSRTFQPSSGGAMVYSGKYVRVNLTAIEISVYNMVSNVNKGQNYSYFPEERRCVVFQIA